MFYYLFEYLDKIDFTGAGLFQYLSFRAALTAITSLIVSMIFGKKIIRYLQKKQIGEVVRDLGLEGQYEKRGTPTMGGIIIIAAILIPVLLFANLGNIYIILMLITTVWMGIIGFIDDYIKTFKKKKAGLSGKYKIFGQVTLGLIVGLTFYFSDDIQIREHPIAPDLCDSVVEVNQDYFSQTDKPLKTTIPFVKNNELDYKKMVSFTGENSETVAWIAFVILVIFIITAVSNGANMTDGLDGLATGTSSIIGAALAIFAYVSGNLIFADYLNIMYIPNIGELVVFAAAFMGATIGFLWYNSYPAQVFMGDTGSLTIGGIIAVFAIIVRKELLIPILAGIFLIENLSVMLQVGWFKYTRKKFGEGRRIFLMAPLHHHFQKKGYPESKIVSRFWIVGILLAIITIITLKIR
ncbi:MAG: phospho-N-acetylmuramoyl-pentapeptide-transferase [Bacteroidales bacterium]|nr:phospho-N-acetylmuramoyl-pentapeptide-transferase [Bacteroidales bacterium]